MDGKSANPIKGKKEILAQVHFGQRIAEEESKELLDYFGETEEWRSILSSDVDIVYGSKGSGKSAIYSLLLAHQHHLNQEGISAIAAENPQGAPVFDDLKIDPPASEREFRGLWKLYFVCLVGSYFQASGISNKPSKEGLEKLEEAELLAPEQNIKGMLYSVLRRVRRMAQAESISLGEIQMDPITGLPKWVIGKITLPEPAAASRRLGMVTPDDLFEQADAALRTRVR